MKAKINNSLKDLESRRPFFIRIGLLFSLLITFVAFEWRTAVKPTEIIKTDEWEIVETELIPEIISSFSEQQPAKPEMPKSYEAEVRPAEPIIVPDTKPIEPAPAVPLVPSDIIPITIKPEPDPAPEPFLIVEVMPEFPGGEIALNKFLRDHTRFPDEAREAGVEGMVHMSFVIDEKGNIADVKCMRSPGSVLTEEALRVISLMPKWKPGIQGGKKVNVIMTLPFNFKLLKS